MALTEKYSDDLRVPDMCILDFPQSEYGFTTGIELFFFRSLLCDLWFEWFFLSAASDVYVSVSPPCYQINCQIPVKAPYFYKI